jgi:hypothetical protein
MRAGHTNSIIKASLPVLTLLLAASASAEATQISPAVCAMGYDKRDFVVEVANNAEASLMFTILDKPCTGPVLARFGTTTAVEAGSNVSITFRARCMATNGYANACTPGQVMKPMGNFVTLVNTTSNRWETHSYEFIIEHQKPGQWKYELMIEPDKTAAHAFVKTRTMVVEAHPE